MDKETYIQKYLHHQLSAVELREFELMMKTDLELKREVEILANLNVVNKKAELKHIQGVLYEAEMEGEDQGNKQFRNTKNYLKILLIVLLLLTIAFTSFMLLKGDPKSNTIYASFYKTPSNTFYPLVRDGEEGNPAIKEAFAAYEQKDYERSENLLRGLTDYDQNPEIQFYHAISLLEIDNLQAAKARLETIKTEDEYLLNEVQWHRALIAIKLGNFEQAKDFLNTNNLSQKPSKWREILEKL